MSGLGRGLGIMGGLASQGSSASMSMNSKTYDKYEKLEDKRLDQIAAEAQAYLL